ncbi:MAG: dienelactone hydrolase family protein, partial [Planctomycetia bacterium]|nr:dienelactone hydrolase family protein [Planctomycetia bacterium]
MRPLMIGSGLLMLVLAFAGDAAEELDPAKAKADPKLPLLWYDVRELGVEGQGWQETKSPFDRLPGKADGVVRAPVWNLSRHSAGMAVRFVTDAKSIQARWTLTSESLAMPHMPATGVSGLDLYVRQDGQWRWLGAGRPTAKGANQQAQLVAGLPPGKREFLLYLPLYNGVTSVEIGIAKDHGLARAEPRLAEQRQPIVFYGTSITQGGCASRPGMAHAAILGRRLDRPVINLGFSGNGKMDPEMGQLLAELDPAVFIIECLSNMSTQEVADRTEPLVRTLRKARPTTPIVLVEDPTYGHAFLLDEVKQRSLERRAAFRKAYDRLIADGVPHLHYLADQGFYGHDGEATVDGVHATDLGYQRLADAYAPLLTKVLGGEKSTGPQPPRELATFFQPPEQYRNDFGNFRSPLRFADGTPVKNAADWQRRRAEILAHWTKVMGPWPALLDKPRVEVVNTTRRENITQQQLRLGLALGEEMMDAFLLVPEGKGPFPAVVVVYYDAQTGVGLGTKLRDYGWHLAKRGFVVLSLGKPNASVNLEDSSKAKGGPYLGPAGKPAQVQPLSVLAYAAANAQTWLAKRPDVLPDRIGIVGHSFGGKWALMASCLHEPFACAVWSDPGIVFDERDRRKENPGGSVNYWDV